MRRVLLAAIVTMLIGLGIAPAAWATTSVDVGYGGRSSLDGYANQLSVNVRVYTENCRYRLSNDGVIWSAWDTVTSVTDGYTAYRSWTLPDADGLHTVWMQPEDGSGTVSTTVILDRVRPKVSYTVRKMRVHSLRVNKVRVTATATDRFGTQTKIGVYMTRNMFGSTVATAPMVWMPTSGGVAVRTMDLKRRTYPQAFRRGDYVLWVECRDSAGNYAGDLRWITIK